MDTIIISILTIFITLAGPLLTIFDLPGNTTLMLTHVTLAIYDKQYLDWNALYITIIIYIAGESWEFFVSLFGIKKEKVTWKTVSLIVIGGFIGTCIGTGFIPIIGSFIGGLIGVAIIAYLYEYSQTGNNSNAKKLAFQAAKIRFIAISGKLISAFCLAYMLASTIIKHIQLDQINIFFF